MIVLDRAHRIVWSSEGYERFVALGPFATSGIIGRRIQDVVPNSLMGEVIDSGRAIPIDLLTNQYGSFLVSRLPLRDESGQVIGGLALVFLDRPDTTMQPLMVKFTRLQRELDDARRELAAQRRPKYTIASFVGASPVAMAVKRHARRVAQTDSTVLLLGETGTGKELLAQGIHAASARASRPFIGVNIAAVPDSLLEAEFFGVAAGAFTGADKKGRDGKFKVAEGGTLFLDEIGDMPLALQAKLLRVLQEQEVERLGSNEVQRIDVRVIAATSRELLAMVAAGNVPRRPLLPPERAADPPSDLARADVRPRIARRSARRRHLAAQRHAAQDPDGRCARASRQLLWPGNIRELRNVLEQATLMTDDLVLAAPSSTSRRRLGAGGERRSSRAVRRGGRRWLPDRPGRLRRCSPKRRPPRFATPLPDDRGNKAAACRLLGISRAGAVRQADERRR